MTIRYKIPMQVLVDLANALGYRVISIQHGKVNLTDPKTKKTFHWNPLISNDDAMRLASDFEMILQFACVDDYERYCVASWWPENATRDQEIPEFQYYADHNNDPLLAMRYAITRLVAKLKNIEWNIENAE